MNTFTTNLPVDIWRHSFKLLLEKFPLYIFKFTKEIILLGEYTKEEIQAMIKASIIRNYEINNLSFILSYLVEDGGNGYKTILKSKIFLENLDLIKSMEYFYLFPSIENHLNFVLRKIIESNNFILFEWFLSLNKFPNHKMYSYYVTASNNLEMLRYLKDHNFPIDINCCPAAISNNNLEILKIIVDENDPSLINEFWFLKAVELNNVEMVKILSNGNKKCSWGKECCLEAIHNNNLEMLKVLRSGNKPCPWDKIRCSLEAVSNNNLEILRFIRKGKDPCPWDEACCYEAVCNNNIEILRFLRSGSNPCPWGDKNFCIKKAKSKEMIKFIKEY
jgi:hypothetical protein